MTGSTMQGFTAFQGGHLLASGTLAEVAISVKRAMEAALGDACLVFDDRTGRVVDLDLRGTEQDVVARLPDAPDDMPAGDGQSSRPEDGAESGRGRGRPRLGVIAREVTLLPRHWDWLSSQPGGASAALRRLVEDARRQQGGDSQRRSVQEAVYRVMTTLAGDCPGYEEATRILFASDRAPVESRAILEGVSAAWPGDVQAYVLRLHSALPD